MPTPEYPDGSSEEARETVRELAGVYARSFRAQCKTIEALLGALGRSSADAESLKALRFGLHRISGSAGSFGFGEASRIARDWGRELEAVTSLSEGDLERMRRRLTDLGATVT